MKLLTIIYVLGCWRRPRFFTSKTFESRRNDELFASR